MTDETKSETPDTPADVASLSADDDTSPDTGTGARAGTDERSTLKRERDEYRDLSLRKTAELDNYRKRIDRERATVAQTAASDLITELLPLIDDLERALAIEVDADGTAAYRAGVELIHKQLLDLLTKRGVSPIDSAGQMFDPNFHQAVAHEASDDHSEGQIIEELRRGYVMGGRLLRPSMVRVAKA